MSENKMQAIVLVAIAYIGAKATKRDTYFGTGLEFARGDIHQVDALTANQMARHKDVYALVESERYRVWKEKFDAGTLEDAQPEPTKVDDTDALIRDKVTELRLEFLKFTKKDQLRTHEVTTKLAVQFAEDDTMGEMTAKVCAAYEAHLIATLQGESN